MSETLKPETAEQVLDAVKWAAASESPLAVKGQGSKEGFGRAIEAGRVWTNCYHQYPAHAAFGGYKASGFGRETHKAMLDHYQQTKNLLVSYDEHGLGLF